MPYFLSPRIIFGKNALTKLGQEIKGKGSRAVLVTDGTMVNQAQNVAEVLQEAGYEVTVWGGAESDPSVEVALAGSNVLQDVDPQWIVGFGGGSAIDTAKAAWVLYERPDLASGDLGKAVLPKVELRLRQKARLIAVPTTSGTGADVTWVAVLTDVAKNRKIIFAHNDIVPDLSVLDPGLTVGLPKGLTASTGLDVLAHAIDGYTSRQRTDFSDGPCLQAMKMVFQWLPRACEEGSDMVAREKMQNAATIAGLGFGNSNTGLSHALGHAIGAVFHIPHGRAIGISLPYSLEYIASHPPLANAPDPVERLAEAARVVGIDAGSHPEAVETLIQEIRGLAREIGEPLSLSETGISESQMTQDRETLILVCSKDPNLYTMPCHCEENDIRGLFEKMWDGTAGA